MLDRIALRLCAFMALLAVLSFPCKAAAQREGESPVAVTHYAPISAILSNEQHRLAFAIRSFQLNGVRSYLLVDPQTLKTFIAPEAAWSDRETKSDDLSRSPYINALHLTTSPPYPIQNQGLTHALKPVRDVAFLTIDMCPSLHTFARPFFDRLIAEQTHHRIPVTIDLSGSWILKHREEYAWLKNAAATGALEVTWVNHMYRHRYETHIPIGQNFLLLPGTDYDHEVLALEKLLISTGVTPSVFVRYPGLVSDASIVARTRALGLIPLGADAWLAKGQPINDGAIVLVHGNGNEPGGPRRLTPDVLNAHEWWPIARAVRGETSDPAGSGL